MHKVIQKGLFSDEEIRDLTKAWLAISLAFAIVLGGGFSIGIGFAYLFLLSALTVGVGFILHELSHRAAAQHFGCHARFKSFDHMLILAIIMSFFGFVFAAPGAVMISGPVGVRRNGKISAAGPAANLGLALIFFMVLFLQPTELIMNIAYYGFLINSWLALFNMLPFGLFDGKKILAWNKLAYGIMVGVAVIFMILQASFQI